MTGLFRIPLLISLCLCWQTIVTPQTARSESESESDTFKRIRVALDKAVKLRKPNSSSTGVVESALEEPFHTELMDALIAADRLTPDEIEESLPIERAMMQRKLWGWFDGYVTWQIRYRPKPDELEKRSRGRDLQKVIASLLRKTALPGKEIASLPDTVSATAESGRYPADPNPERPLKAFFPKNLFDETGPWVCLDKSYHRLSATFHSQEQRWRSVFHIYMRLPGNREDTLGYLKTLGDFQDQWTSKELDDRSRNITLPHGGIHYINLHPNPDTPQFPIGTQFALVEQALLIDDTGEPVMSPIVVNVQLRTYLHMERQFFSDRFSQAMAEFSLKWETLAAGDPILEAKGQSDAAKPGKAPVPSTTARCMTCHSGWGIHSVNSRAQLFEPRTLLPPHFRTGDRETTAGGTIAHKREDVSWGLLQGLWIGNPQMRQE